MVDEKRGGVRGEKMGGGGETCDSERKKKGIAHDEKKMFGRQEEVPTNLGEIGQIDIPEQDGIILHHNSPGRLAFNNLPAKV